MKPLSRWLVTPLLLFAALVVALAVGAQSYRLSGVNPAVLLVGVLFGVPVVFFLIRKPIYSLVAIIGFTMFGLYRYEVGLGSAGLRAVDLPYALLVGRALVLMMRGRRVVRRDIGQRQLALFLVAAFVSLLPVITTDSSAALSGLVSWVRFFQAVSLVWLVPTVVTTTSDRLLLMRAVVLLISIELVRAIVAGAVGGGLGGRLDGANGPNSTGLIAAMLLVISLHSFTGLRRWQRFAALSIALAGLGLSRSIGAMAAAGVTVMMFGFYARAKAPDRRTLKLTQPLRIAAMVLVLGFVLTSLRPVNLPSSDGFQSSSTMHRIVLGTAGVVLYTEHPVTGVGWSRSADPDIIGSPEVAEVLRRRYERAREIFFPDVNPGNVHNAYIQIGAEAGTLGFLTFIVALVTMRRRLRRQLARLDDPHELGIRRLFYLALVVDLIWWNDNAIFGAQPETILLGLFLGLLATSTLAAARESELPALVHSSSR